MFPDTGKHAVYPPQPQPFPHKSKVIAEFVDEIPAVQVNKSNLTIFQAQEGVKEALEKAMAHPNKAMILVEYDQGSKSKRKSLAELRVSAMGRQGYTEANGWIVRAVDGKVYVMWQGQR